MRYTQAQNEAASRDTAGNVNSARGQNRATTKTTATAQQTSPQTKQQDNSCIDKANRLDKLIQHKQLKLVTTTLDATRKKTEHMATNPQNLDKLKAHKKSKTKDWQTLKCRVPHTTTRHTVTNKNRKKGHPVTLNKDSNKATESKNIAKNSKHAHKSRQNIAYKHTLKYHHPMFPDSTRRGNKWKRGHNDDFK